MPEVTPVVEEGLIECGYGSWEGQPLKKLAKEPLWPVVQQHPSAAVFPGGESMAAMAARAVAAVRLWDARVTAEQGPRRSGWRAARRRDQGHRGHALGVNLDLFSASSPIRRRSRRSASRHCGVLVRLKRHGGDPRAGPAPRAGADGRARPVAADSDAAVGGGAGAAR